MQSIQLLRHYCIPNPDTQKGPQMVLEFLGGPTIGQIMFVARTLVTKQIRRVNLDSKTLAVSVESTGPDTTLVRIWER